ncbi:MAG: division/cell wall cluster transcriptional repressor MraZ [Endomicrobiia bacterium]
MNIYTGISYHTLDSKNRLFLPPKYRGKTKKYVFTSGIDECVVIYSADIWQDVVKKIEDISLKNKSYQRAFLRTFFADAEIVEIDNQGRILIPQKFKEKYRLIKEVVIVGVKEKIELWNSDVWKRYYSYSTNLLKKIKTQLEI